MRRAICRAPVLVIVAGLMPAAVSADSFTPITVAISVARVARLGQPLRATVRVTADASVLDIRDGQVLAGVKLAAECGGDYEHTTGARLVHLALKPQPDPGEPYSGSVSSSGRPSSYGVQTVCIWLEDAEQRVFAQDDSLTVNVSRPCTTAAARYDRAARARSRSAAALKRAARRACGSGVPL